MAKLRGGGPARGSHRSAFLRQLPFAVVFVLLIVGVFVYVTDVAAVPFFAGVLVAFTATTLSIALPWRLLDERWQALIPVLDIVAVGLVVAADFPAAILLVFPVLWMSTILGAAGVAVSVVASTVAAWGAGVPIEDGIAPADVPRLVLLPIVLVAIGIYIHLSERRSAARQELLAGQSALVEETLADARKQRRLLDSILNTIDVGVVALNPDGRITTINRAHASAVQGRLKVGDHVTHHGGVDGFAADGVTPLGVDGSPLVRASRGENIDRELTWWQDDGRRTAYRISAAQLADHGDGDGDGDGDGSRAGAVVLYQDLTAEMNALAQREDFVSSVSHELRTPLTSMLGYLEVTIEDPALPERLRAHLDVVERNAQRLQRLISDLLLAARTREGFVELDRSEVDLCEILAEAVQSQAPHARKGDVAIEVIAQDACVILADRTRLAQVADNLLSNAVKYSRPGDRVQVVIDRDEGSARLRIRDTGIGIGAGDQEKVFTRFYRAESVRQGPVPGTGLGLHISRQIVHAHGGTIELTSEPGSGTEVTITLPAPPHAWEAARDS